MKETIEARELFVLDGLDVLIRGTYHKAYCDNSSAWSSIRTQDRIGVVFLTSTSPTRAANGDTAVYLADAFAEYGHPSFRLDLPGFGDSEGDLPGDLAGFITRGGYTSIASAKVRELVARFKLSGVILVGHCAGSVSALYTAAACNECRGLVLIGPYFQITQAIRPTKTRRHLKLGCLESRLGRLSSNMFEFLNEVQLSLRGRGLPKNANYPLLRSWKKVVSAGFPILVLKGTKRKTAGVEPGVGEFDYLNYLQRAAGRGSQIVVKIVDGANNAFANHRGRSAIRQHTELWLDAHFPLAGHQESALNIASSECNNESRYPSQLG